MDTVTGLTIIKDKLVSGSKDKYLRLWGLDHSINNAKHAFPAFNDQITLCESNLYYIQMIKSCLFFMPVAEMVK
jgi:hypothetical protein